MRIFFLVIILILNLQLFSKADDIKDFDIDGISIGESLLNHSSKNLIESKNKNLYPNSDEYYAIEFNSNELKFLETYSYIGIHLKKDDKKFLIASIKGILPYKKNFEACLNQKKIIVKSIKGTLSNSKEQKYTNNFNNLYGMSKAYISDFKVKNGFIRIWCTNWDKKTENENGWEDSLNVDLSNQFFLDWLNTKAY
tara:strand:- start:128 stop:715 length:588 start_codon:yes stop_codon:yes gene_type:complete